MTLRILLHDFPGHPFTAELSRELARRGHHVTHAWFAGEGGPKGRLQRGPDDPETLDFLPVGEGLAYDKSRFFRRRQGDIAYGRLLAERIAELAPDLMISSTTPTETQEALLAACRARNIPFVYWCQDFYSIAAARLLRKKLPVLGPCVAAWYGFLERRQMRRATHVLHITESFCAQTDAWGIPRDKVTVIHNWGVIDEIEVMHRDTPWAARQGLGAGTRYLYSGTLAMKHDPELLARLAGRVGPDEEVVLVSAGVGADRLRARAEAGDLPRLRCLPLQPFAEFPQVLGAGDVLLAVLEREAGAFSVPSKILSYLCAGRPIVLAAPKENLAARMIERIGAGRVVDPEDAEGFIAAALAYRDDPQAAARAGAAGRAWAEEHFVLSRVADRFEAVFRQALERHAAGAGPAGARPLPRRESPNP